MQAALAWRDFMVSDHSDTGAQSWLKSKGIDLLRGTGSLAGPGVVEVDGVRHTARHVVLATGSDPVVPPVPGLRELRTCGPTATSTAMTAVPRRLLVLGGGPVGVEMAQAVRRLGGEVALVEGAAHLLARDPRPWARRSAPRCVATDRAEPGGPGDGRTPRGRGVRARPRRRPRVRGDRLLVATGRRPRLPAGLDTVGVTAGRRRARGRPVAGGGAAVGGR